MPLLEAVSRRIDLNADLGEGFRFDEALLGVVSSANVSTGVYTSRPEAVRETLRFLADTEVRCGVHPGYHDVAGFGRRRGYEPKLDKLSEQLTKQLDAFLDACEQIGVRCSYLKPHGALYHDVADNASIAALLGNLCRRHSLPLLHQAASTLEAFLPRELLFSEGFAERHYLPSGRLAAREADQPSSIASPRKAADQALLLARGAMQGVRPTCSVPDRK